MSQRSSDDDDDDLMHPIRAITNERVLKELERSPIDPYMVEQVRHRPDVLAKIRTKPDLLKEVHKNPAEVRKVLEEMLIDQNQGTY